MEHQTKRKQLTPHSEENKQNETFDNHDFMNIIDSGLQDSSDSEEKTDESEDDNTSDVDSLSENSSDHQTSSQEESSGTDSEGDEPTDEELETDVNYRKELEEDTSKAKTNKSKELKQDKNAICHNSKRIQNEYDEYDSSDEEDIRNSTGNVPRNWYDEYKHFGYDWDGKKIIKPNVGDQLDEFLKKMEDSQFWKTVKDPQTGQNIVLSDEDINIIKKITGGLIPDEKFNEYEPWIEWFTSEVMETPLRKFPEHKRSFLPSQHEAKKVSKLVHALKMGWIKTREEAAKLRAKKDPQFYMLWKTDDHAENIRRLHKHIAAPKRHLPTHAESYNPPPEYLFDEREMKQWIQFKDTPWKRKLHFLPQKFQSMRQVPAYNRFVKERFLRCLDLYLCPRAVKMKVNIQPEALVPKLPNPKDLQPFPNTLSVEYKGHTDMVRTISTDKIGQYLLSGSDDNTIKIWEVNTGRCLKTIKTDDLVKSAEWCPNASLSLILVACGKKVYVINPHVGDHLVCSRTDSVLQEAVAVESVMTEKVRTTVHWSIPEDEPFNQGFRIVLTHFREVSQITWHGRGDYFASVMPDGQNRSILISQISRKMSQLPFSKSKGIVQSVLFHPTKPYLFVATQRHVRIYDLVKQTLVKKLVTNSKWISSMAIHPGGDNVLLGTYDRKVLWYDLDLSVKPYQILRLHGTAVRSVAYHKRYPLFASGSDDRSLIVSHGMVYNDLLKNPVIIPLKRLEDHQEYNDFGIFGVHFHPLQPWVFSSGADSTIKLYTN